MTPDNSGDEADADTDLDDEDKLENIKNRLNYLIDDEGTIKSKRKTKSGDRISCRMKELFGNDMSWLSEFRKSRKFKDFMKINSISISAGNYEYQTITINNKHFKISVLKKRKRKRNYVHKERTSYSDKTIQDNLRKSGLQKIFDDMKSIWYNHKFHSDTKKDEILRKEVFDFFISKCQSIDEYRMARDAKMEIDKAIVTSLHSAISELRRNRKGEISKTRLSNEKKFAANVLIRAASYKSGLSSKILSSKLGIFERHALLTDRGVSEFRAHNTDDDIDDDVDREGDNEEEDEEENGEDYASDSDENNRNSDVSSQESSDEDTDCRKDFLSYCRPYC